MERPVPFNVPYSLNTSFAVIRGFFSNTLVIDFVVQLEARFVEDLIIEVSIAWSCLPDPGQSNPLIPLSDFP